MDKIYSRKRIKIPDLEKRENKKIRKTIKTGIIFIIAVFVVVTVYNSSKPIIERLCFDKAKSIATIVSNEQAGIVMKNYEYDELVTIHKDNENNINLIETNVKTVNKIVSEIANNIQKEMNKLEEDVIDLRLGSLTGSRILAGTGPKIPIRVSSVGNIETDFRSEFKEAGVNQTLHRLYLNVECEVSILTPFETIEEKITNQVILAENIIVGKIPQTYYNIEGIEEKSQALEMIE